MKLFTDGGVAGKNPSPVGGSWAWCLVADNTIVRWACGFVQPVDIGREKITNNDTEGLAALLALEAMEEKWNGILHTDSLVTLYRLKRRQPWQLPAFMRERIMLLRQRKRIKVELVKGHPTAKDLANGVHANGSPVSEWNVFCDDRCNEVIQEFLQRKAKSIK